MISEIKTIRTDGTVPYDNLALENVLTQQVREGECILFLWQNRNTVVIGRNQNAWEELRVAGFRESGGFLARRLSGGGAVYHDLGNLNFSFAVRKADYDPVRQSEVILRAVQSLGIPAKRTGRNDFEAEGRKFSGNAFFEHRGCCCHHGTLMMGVDLDRMEEVLTVPQAKLRSRGVSSVRARVVNLREYVPGLNREELEKALTEAFEDVYGRKSRTLEEGRLDAEEIRTTAAMLSSDDWILGRRIPFTAALEERFSWGGIRMEMNVRGGVVREAVCWSDAMDEAFIAGIGRALEGCPYDGDALANRVQQTAEAMKTPERGAMAREIARMIREQTTGG